MKSKRILLVCSGPSHYAEGRLSAAGCKITKVGDGKSALSLTKRYGFDAAVLISTGTEMDVTETALNLRDVSPPMPIFIVVDKAVSRRKALSTARVAELIPRTVTLRIKELMHYLTVTEAQTTPLKEPVRTTSS